MSFIEALFRLRICLFRYVFCRRESSVLGQVCQNSESQIRKPTYRHQPVLCSLIKHTVLANQSVRYMETLL